MFLSLENLVSDSIWSCFWILFPFVGVISFVYLIFLVSSTIDRGTAYTGETKAETKDETKKKKEVKND